MVRLMHEELNYPVSGMDWQLAYTLVNRTWSIELNSVPRGGLYRIETALFFTDDKNVRYELRGDMIHHVGVGDIWLIAGQSNATGYAREAANEGPQLGIHMFRANGRWTLATHPLGETTNTCYSPLLGTRNSGHSPWLAFARWLHAALGFPIGLIPASKGGSSLSEWLRSENGYLFENMLQMVNDAGGCIRGVVWYQGETDTRSYAEANTYKERFARFVEDMRSALGNNHLPIITAQLNRWNIDHAQEREKRWEYIRDVQRQIPHLIKGVYVVPTADLRVTDGAHNNSSANMEIGGRFARLAMGAVYGQNENWRYPDCSSARYVQPDQVVLEFANVYRGLYYPGNLNKDLPFAVYDSSGNVPLEAMKLSAVNCITLKLGRMVQGDVYVTGIPGCNPPAIVPCDLYEKRPILAFTIHVQ